MVRSTEGSFGRSSTAWVVMLQRMVGNGDSTGRAADPQACGRTSRSRPARRRRRPARSAGWAESGGGRSAPPGCALGERRQRGGREQVHRREVEVRAERRGELEQLRRNDARDRAAARRAGGRRSAAARSRNRDRPAGRAGSARCAPAGWRGHSVTAPADQRREARGRRRRRRCGARAVGQRHGRRRDRAVRSARRRSAPRTASTPASSSRRESRRRASSRSAQPRSPAMPIGPDRRARQRLAAHRLHRIAPDLEDSTDDRHAPMDTPQRAQRNTEPLRGLCALCGCSFRLVLRQTTWAKSDVGRNGGT